MISGTLVDLAAKRATPVIIDTDAGSDDLIAIAFLLARPDVPIEAITIANGLAHVAPGATNVLRLLALAGRHDIPVFVGRPAPLKGDASFPAEWRQLSDQLPGVELPASGRRPEPRGAVAFLTRRLRDRHRSVRILALGPLTNLGDLLQRVPESIRAIEEVLVMGGAVNVPGNLGDGGYFKTDNTTAEWNFFVDPAAARIVFDSGVKLSLIGLDATNKVPIDSAFLHGFQSQARTPLAQFVSQVLETDRKIIEQNIYYAWDPLAAAALVDARVITMRSCAIEVEQAPPEAGRTRNIPGRRPNARVAFDADAEAFKRMFLRAFLPRK